MFEIGDRVKVGDMTGTIDSIDHEDQTGIIRWSEEWAPLSFPVPLSAFTRINDEANEGNEE